MPHTADAPPAVCSRVQIGNNKATVKFVGEVQGQSGVWVGVEWDDATRGKNHGATGGQSYFVCHTPGAGSFLRLEKFNAEAGPARTVLAALQDRYDDRDLQPDHSGQNADQAPKSMRNKDIKWQLVGADKAHAKLSQLHLLQKATLITCGVRGTVRTSVCADTIADIINRLTMPQHTHMQTVHDVQGNEADLREAVPQLQELDLSDNLISDWQTVMQLSSALPSLACVNLTRNLMAVPGPADLPFWPVNNTLHTLVLNRCRLNWSQVS